MTSTYVEGAADENPKAARGYSRDNRSYCRRVCIGLVVTREGLDVKLVCAPEGSAERFVLCRSRERAAKECAMLERQIVRLRQALLKIDAGLRNRPSADADKVERRIGRWLGRNPAAERVFEVAVEKDSAGRA